jgi:hypothetical protein
MAITDILSSVRSSFTGVTFYRSKMADTALRVAKYGSIFFAFALFAIYTARQAEKRTLTLESYAPTTDPQLDPSTSKAPILKKSLSVTTQQLQLLATKKCRPWFRTIDSTHDPIPEAICEDLSEELSKSTLDLIGQVS